MTIDSGISMRDKIKILSELNSALECEELTAIISGRPSGELLYEVFKRSVLKEIENIFSTQGSTVDSDKVSKAIDGLDEILSKIDNIKTKIVPNVTAPQAPTGVTQPTTTTTNTTPPVTQAHDTPAPQRVASLPIRGFSPFS